MSIDSFFRGKALRPSVDRKINPPVTVVEGDGEENFLELVRALEKGKSLGKVREIWYKENENGIIFTSLNSS